MDLKGVLDRRGQSLTTSTLILIVVGIVVLVFLIYGFTVGWSNLYDKVSNFGGGDGNVATIVQACDIACTTQNGFEFNQQVRDVDFGDVEIKATCKDLSAPISGCYLNGDLKSALSKPGSSSAVAFTDAECDGALNWDAATSQCEIGSTVVAGITTELACSGKAIWVQEDAIVSACSAV